MAKNLYIATTGPKRGKSAIVLGVMELLLRNIKNVGYFRPIIDHNVAQGSKDKNIELITEHFGLDISYEETYAFTLDEANDFIANNHFDHLLEGILSKYKVLEEKFDFILIEGTNFERSTSAHEFDINAEIAHNLASPVLLVASGKEKNNEEIIATSKLSLEAFEDKGCDVISVIVNRVNREGMMTLRRKIQKEILNKDELIYIIPEDENLGNPAIRDIVKSLNAEVLFGEGQLNFHVHGYLIAAMQLCHFITYVKEGFLIIVPGDRADILLATLVANKSESYPHIAGIVLTGGFVPPHSITELIKGLTSHIPILSVKEDTLTTATRLKEMSTKISPHDKRMIATALGLFDTHVDIPELREKIIDTKSDVMTPKMFEYRLIQKAISLKKHIVLPEGIEDRILKAAEILIKREVVKITLLGNEKEIKNKISSLGLKLDKVNIIDPLTSEYFEDYVNTYYELRKHKNITIDYARDTMADTSYFGTMMVHKGHADGMVSGSIHTTQHTIRPSFEFIKTKPGVSIVSSVFLMALSDKVLVYGDCAVNPNPNPAQLAEIAISSAQTAEAFQIPAKVAMLSYSTGESGKGEDVEKVREATKIAKERAPELKLEGPMQYDAAVDIKVARTKMPDSEVAGHATVLIFPDLNTGNNTYKAVQRSANAVAIGPVLQGLNKPVNDLSRGCTVPDIVNTVVITAIQAENNK